MSAFFKWRKEHEHLYPLNLALINNICCGPLAMKVAILMYSHTCTRKNMQHLHISYKKNCQKMLVIRVGEQKQAGPPTELWDSGGQYKSLVSMSNHLLGILYQWTDNTGAFNEHYYTVSYLKVGLSIHSSLMTPLITSRLPTVRLEPEWKE